MWENKITQYKLDPTLSWKFAEIISFNENTIKFKLIDKNKNNLGGVLYRNDIKWTLRQNKSIKETYKVGDILFVKKKKMAGKLNSILK